MLEDQAFFIILGFQIITTYSEKKKLHFSKKYVYSCFSSPVLEGFFYAYTFLTIFTYIKAKK